MHSLHNRYTFNVTETCEYILLKQKSLARANFFNLLTRVGMRNEKQCCFGFNGYFMRINKRCAINEKSVSVFRVKIRRSPLTFVCSRGGSQNREAHLLNTFKP